MRTNLQEVTLDATQLSDLFFNWTDGVDIWGDANEFASYIGYGRDTAFIESLVEDFRHRL